jgi:fatty acid desaturase
MNSHLNGQAKSDSGVVEREGCAVRGSLSRALESPSYTASANVCPPAGEYADLKELLERKGLFVRQPVYDVLKIIFAIGLLILSAVLLVVMRDFRLQILDAALMAIVCTQLAFFFHDAGHGQIFQTDRMNDVLGLILANLLLGWSYGRWVSSHNRHHAHPNQLDLDPDISDVPIVAFTEAQARKKLGPMRLLTKFQACCFPLLTLLSAFSWRIRSIQYVWQKKVRYRSAEAMLLVAHSALYFGSVFFLLPVEKAVLFVLCHNALFGLYIGSVFAASHKGMLYVGSESRLDFLRQQILSTRNIRAHPLSDLWYGPMACHIEHHLFPRIPRSKLAKARRTVKAFCLQRRIPYQETGGLRSYWDTLRHLHRVSAPLRRAVRQRHGCAI